MKALLCAGGTGGHILPAVVLARLMKDRKWIIRFLCREKDAALSERLSSLKEDLVFLPGRGLSRKPSLDWFRFAADLVAAFFQSVKLVSSFRPDVVVTFGGYLGFAPVLAAALLGRPVVMIEQNSVPGLANRAAAPFCRKILLHFASAKAGLKRGVVTGHPVDPNIGSVSRKKGLAAFGIASGRKTLLVTGGSQGAVGLNAVVLEAVKQLKDWNILWSCGKNGVREISAAFGPSDEGRVSVAGFFEDMASAYAAADVAVCRAGAATLSELAAAGLPAVLVPYPAATDDHQYLNAESYARAHPAVVIREKDLNSEWLVRSVKEFAERPRPATDPADVPRIINDRILGEIVSVVTPDKGKMEKWKQGA